MLRIGIKFFPNILNLSDEPKFTLLGSPHMAFQGIRCSISVYKIYVVSISVSIFIINNILLFYCLAVIFVKINYIVFWCVCLWSMFRSQALLFCQPCRILRVLIITNYVKKKNHQYCSAFDFFTCLKCCRFFFVLFAKLIQ